MWMTQRPIEQMLADIIGSPLRKRVVQVEATTILRYRNLPLYNTMLKDQTCGEIIHRNHHDRRKNTYLSPTMTVRVIIVHLYHLSSQPRRRSGPSEPL